ncbi:hypothetical protein BH23ACT9_BH23ACT9_23920 [soil metagenome]
MPSPGEGSGEVCIERLSDGRAAVLLRCDPAASGPLVWGGEALQAALEGVGDEAVVIWCPADVDPAPVLRAAIGCDARTPVLATPAPVTDAIKRVEGDRVAATVDRSVLRWAVPPAAVSAEALRSLLADGAIAEVRPLSAGAGPLGWMPPPEGDG